MNKKNAKMNTKNVLVSFLLIASVLFLASMVSAVTVVPMGTASESVKVNDIEVYPATTGVSVDAGDTITVKVQFTADNGSATWESASDVRVKITLEGEKSDVVAITPNFDVIDGKTYTKSLTLKVPSDFQNDNLNEELNMDVKIWNSDEVDTEISGIALELQRPSYDAAIKSIMTSSTVEAGQLLPVDIVLKNIGFNTLKDVYVTASIDDLKLSKTVFFGDLVDVQTEDTSTDDSDKSTVSGRLYLEIPYSAESGKYTLKVTAENDETRSTMTKEVSVNNGFPNIAMKSGNEVVLLNPTNQLKVYTLKYEDTETVVIVPASSSKSVTIQTPTTGEYNFDVAVLSGDQLVGSVNFSGTGTSVAPSITSPVMVLTVILAVVFLVLLVVLIVLITKKPQKTEEFGESYY